jgi:hypothetical protein
MCVQVLPASVDLYTPFPMETLLRMKLSPVPTQTTLGSEGAMARAPIDCAGWSSKIGFQCTPPSVDFQTPPEAAPA